MSEGKTLLRQQMKARRQDLFQTETSASDTIAERFPMKLFERFGPIVSGYLPIGTEVDVRPLMKRLAQNGAQLALPRVEADNRMTFRHWEDDAELEAGQFSLSQPSIESAEVKPTLVLMPLLAFDALGNRLGYGQGHYDRALSQLRETGRVFTCGIAFSGQQIETIPAEPHDVPLDWVVTESGSLPLFLQRASTPGQV